MIDREELLIQLYERGIDASITTKNARYVVQFDDIKSRNLVGIASGNSPEEAIAQLIRRIASDSQAYKAMNSHSDRLTVL